MDSEYSHEDRLEALEKAFHILAEGKMYVEEARERFNQDYNGSEADFYFRQAVNDLHRSDAIELDGQELSANPLYSPERLSVPEEVVEALLSGEFRKEVDPDRLPVYTDHLKRHYNPVAPDLEGLVNRTMAEEVRSDGFRVVEYWLEHDVEQGDAELVVRSISKSPPLEPEVIELFREQESRWARAAWEGRENKLRVREEPKGGGSWKNDSNRASG